MKVEFCGVRGSIPKPQSADELLGRLLKHSKNGVLTEANLKKMAKDGSLSYGADTSCVFIEHEGQHLILDAGTGIRRLNDQFKNYPLDKPIHILLTHLHWDHIQGLPFFTPVYQTGRVIYIHSAVAPEVVEKAFRHQWKHPYFPVAYEDLPSTMNFVGFKKKCKLGPYAIDSVEMNHPDPTFGYKITAGGKSYAHFSDTELWMISGSLGKKYQKFLEGVDFLTADAQFDLQEIELFKSWGHSAIISFINLLKNSKVKTIAMFHYNPQESEEKIGEIYRLGQKHLKITIPDGSTRLICAIEGQSHQI